MAEFDLVQLLRPGFSKAGITSWNRLDSFPRTTDIGRGLKGEVRDALWMLTRQWQFGEFRAEDAGSPVHAKVSGMHVTPSGVSINEKAFPYDSSIPLEAIAERETVASTLRLNIQMGRMFLKLLRAGGVHTSYPFFISNFPLSNPGNDETSAQGMYHAVKGRVANGFDIYVKAKKDAATFFNDFSSTTLPAAQAIATIRDVVFPQFIKWFDGLYFQPPAGESAWQANRMEYTFKVNFSSNAQSGLTAPEYRGGRLDWTDFDMYANASFGSTTTNVPATPGEEKSDVFLPTIVTYKGMPHPRFWQMEEGTMDFGKIEQSPAGVVGLLLAEYGLTYSNDWFLLPYPAAINTVCSIQGIVVTDVFGQRNFVAPYRSAPESQWQQFALFGLSQNRKGIPSRQAFYLPPVTGVVQAGEPLERVFFMRDEMANLVWAIEDVVPSQTGGGRKIVSIQPPVVAEEQAADLWKYTLGTTVPQHWIPFVAVHRKNNEQGILLQRARMPNATPAGSVLLTENQPTHFVENQEVPRSGVIVERAFQRLRWMDGRTFTWIGRRKITGKGEGGSGLQFDQLK